MDRHDAVATAAITIHAKASPQRWYGVRACEARDAAACAALFADVASPGSDVRGVGAVGPGGALATAVVRQQEGGLRLRQQEGADAPAGGAWRVAFAVDDAAADVFANMAARLCAANIAAEPSKPSPPTTILRVQREAISARKTARQEAGQGRH